MRLEKAGRVYRLVVALEDENFGETEQPRPFVHIRLAGDLTSAARPIPLLTGFVAAGLLQAASRPASSC